MAKKRKIILEETFLDDLEDDFDDLDDLDDYFDDLSLDDDNILIFDPSELEKQEQEFKRPRNYLESPKVDYPISQCMFVKLQNNNKWEEGLYNYLLCGKDKRDFLDKLERADSVLRLTRKNWNIRKKASKHKDAMVFVSKLVREYKNKAIEIDEQIIYESMRDPIESYHKLEFDGVIETPGDWDGCEEDWCPQYQISIERWAPNYFDKLSKRS